MTCQLPKLLVQLSQEVEVMSINNSMSACTSDITANGGNSFHNFFIADFLSRVGNELLQQQRIGNGRHSLSLNRFELLRSVKLPVDLSNNSIQLKTLR